MTAITATGSRHSLALVVEATYGVTPATPVFVPIRHNGTTLALSKATLQSAELRADRQIAGFRSGTHTAAGDITSEVTAGGSFDTLLQMALMGAWTAGVLKVGSARQSCTLERHFNDIGQYARFRGCEVAKLAISVKTSGIATAQFSITANDADAMAATIITGATYPAALTTQPMTGLEAAIKEGGAAIALISDITLNLDNRYNPLFVVGQANGLQPSVGKSDVTGSITAYFADAVLYNKFVSETASQLEFTLADKAGNSYDFLLPNVKYTAAPLPVQNDGPVSMQIPFQALLDTGTATNLQITRVPTAGL